MQSAHRTYPSSSGLLNDSLDCAPLLGAPPHCLLAVPGSGLQPSVLDASESSPAHVPLDPAPPNFKSREAGLEKHAAAHVDLPAWKEDTQTQSTARQEFAGGGRALYKPHCDYGHSRPRRLSLSYAVALIITFLLAICALLATGNLPLCSGAGPTPRPASPTQATTVFAPAATRYNWGSYTPWYPTGTYPQPPSNCEIDQVNILQRHGARFPASGATTRFKAVITKLAAAASYDAQLAFLAHYTYTLGQNDLIPFGAFQSEESGKAAYARYKHLISKTNIPFVRASSLQRVVDSATNWTTGFSLASHGAFNPVLSVILSESGNDTLNDGMCPSAGSSRAAMGAWASVFGAPIAARLNRLAPGANLTAADIPIFMPLCTFETLVKQTLSPFCALFSAAEWAQFEYWADLDKYYGTGYGQALGRVQGVGYVNELLARLTGTPVRDATQTNRTLDADTRTFPLDRALYADFSHGNQMAAIYTALGLFRQPRDLGTGEVAWGRTWITSRLTPFSSRMVTERLVCRTGRSKETFVRVLVNEALQPLEFCGGDKHGLCTLSAFVASQGYARNNGEGDFEKCFV